MRRLLILLALLCSGLLHADVPVPPLQAHVTDTVGLLSADQRAALEQKLVAFEQRKGSQLAVLTVASTAPEAIEQYGIRVAEAWKLGRKGTDDGLILLVARDDHAVRIEVGYGLEGVVPDAVANRVIDEILAPHFRDGDFAGGIDAAMTRLIGLIDGEPLPPPPAHPAASNGSTLDNSGPLGGLLMVALVIGQILRALVGPLLAGIVVGVGGFAAGFLLVGSLAAALLLGIGGFVLTLFGVMFLGGGGFGGGGGNDGFRGGGGGFGGGGASGRW